MEKQNKYIDMMKSMSFQEFNDTIKEMENELRKEINNDIKNGYIPKTDDDGIIGFYDVHEREKEKREESKRQDILKRQLDQTEDNEKLDFYVKISVGDALSANFMTRNSFDKNENIVHSGHTQKYKEYRQLIFKALDEKAPELKNLITRENTDLLNIDLLVSVNNTRKDIDNIEKPIIDSLAAYLGINDNIIKIKKALPLKNKRKNSDYFVFKFQKITSNTIQNIAKEILKSVR